MASKPVIKTEFDQYFAKVGVKDADDGSKIILWQGVLDDVQLALFMRQRPIESKKMATFLNASSYVEVEVSGDGMSHALLRRIGMLVSIAAMGTCFLVHAQGTPPNRGIFAVRGRVLAENNGMF